MCAYMVDSRRLGHIIILKQNITIPIIIVPIYTWIILFTFAPKHCKICHDKEPTYV